MIKHGSVFILFILLLDCCASGLAYPVIVQKLILTDNITYYSMEDVVVEVGLIAILASSYILMTPIIGFVSDIVGRKKPIIYCLGFSFLGYALAIIGIHYEMLFLVLISTFMIGVGLGLLPLGCALIADLSSKNERILGYFFVSIPDFAILPIAQLANLLTQKVHISFLDLLYIALILEAIAIFIAALFLKESDRNNKHITYFSFIKLRCRAVAILKSKRFLGLLCIYFAFAFSWGIYDNFLLEHLIWKINFAFSITQIFVIYSSLTMIIGALVLFPMVIKKSFPSLKQIFLLLIFFVTALILWVFLKQPVIQWVIALPVNLIIGLLAPLFWMAFIETGNRTYCGLIVCTVYPLFDLIWTIGSSGVGIF